MTSIEMKNIVKRYDDGFLAVDDVSIDVQDGEFMILVGPSGCGKSTLLRMIVGLEDITEGEMVIGDKVVNDLSRGASVRDIVNTIAITAIQAQGRA